ncbi:MAG: threonine/serine exporter family protein [Streptococcus sp.]
MAPLPLDLEQHTHQSPLTSFASPISHYHLTLLAHYRRCPATVFLASSMFPLIPGMSFYHAVYFLLIGNADLGLSSYGLFLASFTIAIAVSLTQQILAAIFVLGKKK